MNPNELIDAFETGVGKIVGLVGTVPTDAYDFMPTKADDWTIRQHVIHLVDCEVNNFVRVKSCVAQPFSSVFVVNELDWVKNLANRKESVEDYLDLFSLLRKILAAFLRTVPEAEFRSRYFVRDYDNEIRNITLFEAVEIYCNHVDFHVDYIKRILDEYAGKKS